jgi:hypothetical protein
MFFRTKSSGPRSYLQIVENRWEGGRTRQRPGGWGLVFETPVLGLRRCLDRGLEDVTRQYYPGKKDAQDTSPNGQREAPDPTPILLAGVIGSADNPDNRLCRADGPGMLTRFPPDRATTPQRIRPCRPQDPCRSARR